MYGAIEHDDLVRQWFKLEYISLSDGPPFGIRKPLHLAIVSESKDFENKLVLLLGYDQFPFIKILLKNQQTGIFIILHLKFHTTK